MIHVNAQFGYAYFFFRSGGRDANGGRASKRMEFLQFWTSATILVALEDLDVV